MKVQYSISICLDTRRKKKNGKFPVKLQVYTPMPRKQKLYPTIFEMTEKEFEKVWLTVKPRSEYKPLRDKIQAIEVKANKVAESMEPFTFEQFERKLYRRTGDGIMVKYHYDAILKEKSNRILLGSFSAYEYSMKSISDFTELKHSFEKLTLYDITPEWLKDYERNMIEVKHKSITTVGIYLRALRAVYNKAIEEGEVDREFYPFGKRKYQIPAGRNIKKALSQEQLAKLFNADTETPDQEKAKDFWFFSYACNGMNVKDIALLKYGDIKDGKLEFYRAKTFNTTKGNLKPISLFLNDFALSIIVKYGNENVGPETLVFNIIQSDMKPQEQHNRIKIFTRFINQHIKKLCKAIDLPEQISTYWARHSFATSAIRKGATMEFMQESLGHGNLKTTQNYFAGFDDESKKEFAQGIMDF